MAIQSCRDFLDVFHTLARRDSDSALEMVDCTSRKAASLALCKVFKHHVLGLKHELRERERERERKKVREGDLPRCPMLHSPSQARCVRSGIHGQASLFVF